MKFVSFYLFQLKYICIGDDFLCFRFPLLWAILPLFALEILSLVSCVRNLLSVNGNLNRVA